MTAPREIVPGRTYLITRRCTQRQYLLRPDAKTNGIFTYCLGEAAERHGVDLIAWVAMSNHYHAVVHDPEGKLPAFLEHFHKMLARALNVRWGRWENLWSTEETCVTHLPTTVDVFDKVVYVLANPIADHLVDRVVHWPGSTSLDHLTKRTSSHARPRSFFSAEGRMPPNARLHAVQPPCSKKRESFNAWSARVRDALAAKERTLHAERARDGRRVMGRKAILAMSAFASPTTSEPRRNLRPAVACKNRDERVRLLAKLVEFRSAYREARLAFAAGKRKVEFPAGTYRLRAWGARCAPFPRLV